MIPWEDFDPSLTYHKKQLVVPASFLKLLLGQVAAITFTTEVLPSWLRTTTRPTSIFYARGNCPFRVRQRFRGRCQSSGWATFKLQLHIHKTEVSMLQAGDWTKVSLFVSTADVVASLSEFQQVPLRGSSPLLRYKSHWCPACPRHGVLSQQEQISKLPLVARLPLPRGWDLPGWVVNRKASSPLATQEEAEWNGKYGDKPCSLTSMFSFAVNRERGRPSPETQVEADLDFSALSSGLLCERSCRGWGFWAPKSTGRDLLSRGCLRQCCGLSQLSDCQQGRLGLLSFK